MAKRKFGALVSSLRQEHKEKKAKQVAVSPSKKPSAQTRPLVPFTQSDRILFIGEGNFSFAASCVEHHLEHAESVLATSLDSHEEVTSKYPDVQAQIDTIIDCCGTVQHGIDATKLDKHFRHQQFDVVVFMFPHVAAGIADEARNVQTNQKMLLGFFKSVQAILSVRGTVAVTLAENKTYDLWDIRKLAKSTGLSVKTSGVFDGKAFPGYTHARTIGYIKNDAGFSGGRGEARAARWTIFEKKQSEMSKSDHQDEDEDE